MSQADMLSINTVAAKLGLSVHQLRRWELMFGLEIKRGRGQQRQYRAEDLTVLERIKELVEQGWPTSQIRPQLEAEGLITPKLIGAPQQTGNPEMLMEAIIGLRSFSERRFIEISKQIDELRQLMISITLRNELKNETSSPWQPVREEFEAPRSNMPAQEISIGPAVNVSMPSMTSNTGAPGPVTYTTPASKYISGSQTNQENQVQNQTAAQNPNQNTNTANIQNTNLSQVQNQGQAAPIPSQISAQPTNQLPPFPSSNPIQTNQNIYGTNPINTPQASQSQAFFPQPSPQQQQNSSQEILFKAETEKQLTKDITNEAHLDQNLSQNSNTNLTKQIDDLQDMLIDPLPESDIILEDQNKAQLNSLLATVTSPLPNAPLAPPVKPANNQISQEQNKRTASQIFGEVTDQNYLTVLGRALDMTGWSDEQADQYCQSSFGVAHWDELGRSQAEKLILHLSEKL